MEPIRTEHTRTEVVVRHVMQPFGRERTNPPSLGDIRKFVTACDNLPDDLLVVITKGSLDEGGRHSYTFTVRQQTDLGDIPDEAQDSPVVE